MADLNIFSILKYWIYLLAASSARVGTGDDAIFAARKIITTITIKYVASKPGGKKKIPKCFTSIGNGGVTLFFFFFSSIRTNIK